PSTVDHGSRPQHLQADGRHPRHQGGGGGRPAGAPRQDQYTGRNRGCDRRAAGAGFPSRHGRKRMGPRLKLPPYVHAFVDRHGKSRYYFRRAGYKQVPLPGLPWSPGFMAAYESAMGGDTAARVEIGAGRTRPGTINALVVGYYKSDDWRGLSIETQKTRR